MPLTPEKALIFRITHIENVPWCLTNGIHACNSSQRDPNFREIGNPDLISRRHRRQVPVPPGGTLSDYVPFYFTPYSPMLYNIKTGYGGMKQTPMRDIVILVSSLVRLEELGVSFLFTDRHAVMQAARFCSDRSDLSLLDWKILDARDFKRSTEDPEKVERYQAESLIHQVTPIDALLGIACQNDTCQARVEKMVKDAGRSIEVISRPGWYF